MGSINNSFRFGTVDSADYNLLVAGDGTFNAPERDVDTIEIPGRNGDLLIDKGRFKNITVEYTVYCYADDLETFRTQLRNFRNALSSQKGYQKLTDTFHPDEYRLGTFISGFEAEPVMFNTVAEVVLKFDCKPQRFLFSGEEVFTLGEWGETETYSGSIASFDGTETTAIKSLKVNITPKQSGSGDPSPSNVRPISGYDTVNIHVSPTTTAGDGNTYPISLGQTVYGGVLDVVSGKLTINRAVKDLGTVNWQPASSPERHIFRFYANVLDPQIAYPDSSTPTTALCEQFGAMAFGPISASDNYKFAVGTPSNTILTFIAQDYSTVEAFTTAMNGVKLVYPLATPTELTLTPTEVKTLLGSNSIWADAGTVEVEVGENPNILTNPTPFTAQPIFEVEGSGTLTVNNSSMTIANNGTTVIDSEMMEAYEEENGAIISRNDSVSGEFPTLKEGNNNIGTVGLTSVKVKPKWWEV